MATVDIKDKIQELIAVADPDGRNARLLSSLLGKVKRGVVLTPSDYRFIGDLMERLQNVECSGVTHFGHCTKLPGVGRCPYTEDYRRCTSYEERKAQRGKPLQIGGQ